MIIFCALNTPLIQSFHIQYFSDFLNYVYLCIGVQMDVINLSSY